MKVGQEIKRRRVAKDVQQAHLAFAIGRSQGWVSLVERGLLVPGQEFVEKIFAAIEKIAAVRNQADPIKQISQAAGEFTGLRLPSRVAMANRSATK